MFQWLKSLFLQKYRTGVAIDDRFIEEKQRDWLHEEIAYGPQYSKWDNDKSQIKKYILENQYRTESCVAHAGSLALGIDNELEGLDFIRLSKAFIYRQRSNYPQGGMILADMGSISKNIGSCDYDLCPTPLTEGEINSTLITKQMTRNADAYRAKNYVQILNCSDIDTLNSVISQGKAVVILIYANRREWITDYPQVLDYISLSDAPIRHSVCVLPKSGFIEADKKYIAVQDSVTFWGNQIKYLSEDFIKTRCYGAMYFVNLQNPIIETKPIHRFNLIMKYGSAGEEVAWLQKCLAYEGLFAGQPTGFFGGISLKAVNDFQKKYAGEILLPLGLQQPTGIVGNSTIVQLNKLFAN